MSIAHLSAHLAVQQVELDREAIPRNGHEEPERAAKSFRCVPAMANSTNAGRLFFAAYLLLALLLFGCGGGGTNGGNISGPDIQRIALEPNSATVLMPTDGSVTLVSITDQEVVFSGALPEVNVGNIVVWGGEQAFQRKVLNVEQLNPGVKLGTEQSTLTEAFDRGCIYSDMEFNSSTIGDLEPAVKGVEFSWEPGPPNSRGPLNENLSVSLLDVSLGANVTLDGHASIGIGPAIEGLGVFDFYWNKIEGSGVEAKLFAGIRTKVEASISIEATVAASFSHDFAVSKPKIGTPFRLPGAPYISVYPVIQVFANVGGSFEASGTMSATGHFACDTMYDWSTARGGRVTLLTQKTVTCDTSSSRSWSLTASPIVVRLSFIPFFPLIDNLPTAHISANPCRYKASGTCDQGSNTMKLKADYSMGLTAAFNLNLFGRDLGEISAERFLPDITVWTHDYEGMCGDHIDRLEIQPTSANMAPNGAALFSVRALDLDGHPVDVPAANFSWTAGGAVSIPGSSMGQSVVVLAGSAPGTGTVGVTESSSGKTASAEVTVRDDLVMVTIVGEEFFPIQQNTIIVSGSGGVIGTIGPKDNRIEVTLPFPPGEHTITATLVSEPPEGSNVLFFLGAGKMGTTANLSNPPHSMSLTFEVLPPTRIWTGSFPFWAASAPTPSDSPAEYEMGWLSRLCSWFI